MYLQSILSLHYCTSVNNKHNAKKLKKVLVGTDNYNLDFNKMVGRKAGKGYELYGFVPSVIKGKHVAICKYCNRELQNTAESRMIAHRRSCYATPEVKKISEFLKTNIKNEPMCRRDINPTKDERTHHLSYPKRPKTDHDSTLKREIPFIEHEKAKILNYPDQRKERCSSTIANFSPFVINAAAYETECDDDLLLNIENDSGVVEDSILCSEENTQLQQELEKVEAEYYRTKAAYYAKLAENSKYKKTLLLMKVKKLRLEIEKTISEY